MNQQCKVCGEPAAGFHFGAFTCEGCKSFFGRSYNNLSSISECKNGGECVINKKNRTACKACRLRKCLLVGMSKSGSRYGRRSNWFKIHCLLQEQQQQQQQQQQQHHQQHHQHQQLQSQRSPSISANHMGHRKEEMMMLGIDDYKNSTSPSISSPESHNSDSSVDVSERRAMNHPGFRPLHPHHAAELSALSKEMLGIPLGFPLPGMPLIPSGFLPHHGIPIFPPYHLYGTPQGTPHPLLPGHCGTGGVLHHPSIVGMNNNFNNINATNNNDRNAQNHNSVSPSSGSVPPAIEAYTKRFYLEAVLKSQQTPGSRSPVSSKTQSDKEDDSYSPRCTPEATPPPQDNPMDLSMKNLTTVRSGGRENTSTPESSRLSDTEDNVDMDDVSEEETPPAKKRPSPIDLTCTRV